MVSLSRACFTCRKNGIRETWQQWPPYLTRSFQDSSFTEVQCWEDKKTHTNENKEQFRLAINSEVLCILHPYRISRHDWKKPWGTWSDLKLDSALSRTRIWSPAEPPFNLNDSVILRLLRSPSLCWNLQYCCLQHSTFHHGFFKYLDSKTSHRPGWSSRASILVLKQQSKEVSKKDSHWLR